MLLSFAPFPCGTLAAPQEPVPMSAEGWLTRPEFYAPLAFGWALLLLLLLLQGPALLSWWRARRQETIGPLELEQLLAGTPLTIIDLRPPSEFTGPKGHIRGAWNLAASQIPRELAAVAKDSRQLVVLVDASDKVSHALVPAVLQAGYPWVRVLRGGMRAWRAQHLPVALAGPRR